MHVGFSWIRPPVSGLGFLSIPQVPCSFQITNRGDGLFLSGPQEDTYPPFPSGIVKGGPARPLKKLTHSPPTKPLWPGRGFCGQQRAPGDSGAALAPKGVASPAFPSTARCLLGPGAEGTPLGSGRRRCGDSAGSGAAVEAVATAPPPPRRADCHERTLSPPNAALVLSDVFM